MFRLFVFFFSLIISWLITPYAGEFLLKIDSQLIRNLSSGEMIHIVRFIGYAVICCMVYVALSWVLHFTYERPARKH